MKRMDIDGMWKIFKWGVNYGLLLAEEERDSEDLFDAVGNAVYSRKYNIPSTRAPRRQPRSVEWRKAMADSARDFIEYVALESQEAHRAQEE